MFFTNSPPFGAEWNRKRPDMGYPIIRPCLYILHSSSSSSSLFDDFSLYHRIESVEISRRWGGIKRPCGAGALAQDLVVAKSPKKSNWYTPCLLYCIVCVCVCYRSRPKCKLADDMTCSSHGLCGGIYIGSYASLIFAERRTPPSRRVYSIACG